MSVSKQSCVFRAPFLYVTICPHIGYVLGAVAKEEINCMEPGDIKTSADEECMP